MKTKNRRQSKNVEVIPPEKGRKAKREYISQEIMLRDFITHSDPKLRDKTPIKNRTTQGLKETQTNINPGEGSTYDIDPRTLQETYPTQKKLDKSKPKNTDKIEHIKVTEKKSKF